MAQTTINGITYNVGVNGVLTTATGGAVAPAVQSAYTTQGAALTTNATSNPYGSIYTDNGLMKTSEVGFDNTLTSAQATDYLNDPANAQAITDAANSGQFENFDMTKQTGLDAADGMSNADMLGLGNLAVAGYGAYDTSKANKANLGLARASLKLKQDEYADSRADRESMQASWA